MKKQLGVLVIVLLGLFALAPFSYAQSYDEESAPNNFFSKIFSGMWFSGSQQDMDCRAQWECVKDTNGQYRYDCFYDLSQSKCLCYRTSDPSKCKANQPSSGTTTTTTTSTTSGTTSTCTDSDNSDAVAESTGQPDASIYIKGTTTFTGGLVLTDSCSGSTVYERTCYNGGSATWGFSCPNGCSNGACVSGTGGTGSGCKYNNPSCSSGYICLAESYPALTQYGYNVNINPTTGTCVQLQRGCTLTEAQTGKVRCSGSARQLCTADPIGGTYWLNLETCSSGTSCIVGSDGEPRCLTQEQSQQLEQGLSQKGCAYDDPACASGYTCQNNQCVIPEPAGCIKEGELDWPFGLECCTGLSSAKTGKCEKEEITPLDCIKEDEKLLTGKECCTGLVTVDGLCKKESTLPTEAQDKTQASYIYSEWQDLSPATRIKSACSVTENCAPYEDLSGSDKEYTVKCKQTQAIVDQLTEDSKKVCQSSWIKKVGNGLTWLGASGCIGAIALTGACTLATGGICAVSAPITIGVCAGTASIGAATLTGCAVFSEPDLSKGACIAVPKGGAGPFEWLTVTHDILGTSIPNWGIIAGVLVLLMVLPSLLPKK